MTLLAWQRAGAGSDRRRSVVLVHDWAGRGIEWQDAGWTRALADAGLDVLVPDLPGHGHSGEVRIPGKAVPAAWTAGALHADLQKLGVQRCSIVAEADTAPVAVHFAVTAPERVDRMVLIGADDRGRGREAAEAAAALRDPRARVWSTEASDLVRRARRARAHDKAELARWLDGQAWPAPPRIASLRLPVLLAVGSQTAARERAPRFAQLFDDAHLVTVVADAAGLRSSSQLVATAVRFLSDPNAVVTAPAPPA